MGSRTLALVLAVAMATTGCTFIQDLGLNRSPPPGPGSAYVDYFRDGTETILVELDYAPGADFDSSTPAQDDFVAELERITGKDVLVRSSQDLPERGSDYAYSIEELRTLHNRHQDQLSGDGTQVMHALFLDGEFEGTTAGLAFEPRAMAVFKGQIEDNTCDNDAEVCRGSCPTTDLTCTARLDSRAREWQVTRAVAIHEAGHLLGLVNSPLPMVEPHEMESDPQPDTDALENRSHSSNRSSVMFWQVADAEKATELLDDDYFDGGEIPWRFGRLDVDDAQAAREQH